jgi:hypothetical protein
MLRFWGKLGKVLATIKEELIRMQKSITAQGVAMDFRRVIDIQKRP